MKRKKLELAITVLIYIMTAFMASSLAVLILRSYSKLTEEFLTFDLWMDLGVPAVIAECLAMTISLYNGRYEFEKKPFLEYVTAALKSTVYFVGVWAAMLLIQKNDITDSRYYFVATVLLHFAILTVLLYFVQKVMIANFYKTDAASLVAIIAERKDAQKASELLKCDWSRRLVGIMLTDDDGTGHDSVEEIDHIPVISYSRDIVDTVRNGAIDEVFILESDERSELILKMSEEFAQMGIALHLGLSSLKILEDRLCDETKEYIPKIQSRLGYLGRYPMAILQPPVVKLRFEYAKRLMDIAGGLVGFCFAAILYVILGIAIKLDSPGPVIFAQERIGKNGRRFKMYKFRSMYIDAEERKAELMKQNEMNGLMFKMKDDPRITKVGKFIRKTSLDEFPQFVNVLLGDMSLVGTRPPTVNEFNRYSNYHKRRLSMKPGITGMWQVSGRSDITDFEEVVRLDCQYIDNWSLALDFKILVKTVLAVVMRKGSE
ncbi:sugar transferase [Oribacterium sp. WCC10]|uniref:sugar transferase n=1 Tax=Oribacterium sp. WCC10 TaxID=1855343 RepID=UPI0008EE6148|nr:sugar transferase [Oribacterium sp. WCC10]SFG36744.1 exopolysaccharide biosynthesis polyprenyl glycosylphosphotransferase [Oribacterium sp. WCC10]